MGKIKCEYEERCRSRKTEPGKCESCRHNMLRNYVVDYYIKADDGEIPDKCPKISYDGLAEQTKGYKCPVCGGFTNPYEIDHDLPLCKWCGYLLNI